MPTCSDRQLVQSQIEQGFSTRIGVARAIRPFSGDPAPQNLVDYINRELFPAVKAGREKLNEVYRNVADQAPSANPLNYLFSTSTVNADPTVGRLRLDATPQNTATTIRVSETNAKLVSAFAWLDVMAGSSTTPIGVVTLADSSDPGRFVRFDLTAMVDQGAYWDLTVTPTESSHPNPFVEGESVTIGFIPGVASGPIAINSTVGGVGIRAVSAGTQLLTSGTLSFSNGSGVSFGLNNGTITASVNTAPQLGLLSHVGGNTVSNATRLAFQNSNGVSWTLSTGASAATLLASVNDQSIGLVSHSGGNSASNVSRLLFSNASNVTWSLATGANAVTVIASVAAVGGGGIAAAAGTQTATSGTVVFSNSNNVSFGMSGSTQVTALAFQRIGVITGAATTTVDATHLFFTNTNNVGFALSTNASGATVRGAASIQFSAGTTNGAQSVLSFADSNGVSFGLSSSTVTASYAREIGQVAAPLFTQNSVTQLLFGNSPTVTWSGSTGTAGRIVLAAHAFDPTIGLVSHVAGNSVADVSRIVFSNASNVTWNLSTAAGAVTVRASVAAAAGGGVAIGDGTSTVTSGTLNFTNDGGALNTTRASFPNVKFQITNNSMQATANIVFDANAGGGNEATKVDFLNSNGVSFGRATSSDASGRYVQITASAFVPTISIWNNFQGGGLPLVINSGSSITQLSLLHLFPLQNYGNYAFPGNMTMQTMAMVMNGGATTTNSPAFTYTYRFGLYTLDNSTRLSLVNSGTFTVGSATQSSAAYNASASGVRYLSIHSSMWSSQPVLSYGIQYWMGLQRTVANTNPIVVQNMYDSYKMNVGPQGFIGSSFGVSQAQMFFAGGINTTNIPVSIGATQLISGTNTSSGLGGSNFVYQASCPAIALAGGIRLVYP